MGWRNVLGLAASILVAAPAAGQCFTAMEVTQLLPPAGYADWFGLAVAVDGDTAVVGASDEDTAVGLKTGGAYIFVRSGGVWTQQAHLTVADGWEYDRFGASVAIDGDTVVIGSYGDDTPGGGDAGSAYVFVRSGTVWTQQAKLTASDGTWSDAFGSAVAISGDTVIVGAYFGDSALGTNTGAAYVFTRSGTAWTQQTKLTAADGATNDRFGNSVAIAGNLIIIGARWADTPAGVDSGAAYTFAFVSAWGVWFPAGKLVPTSAGDAWFGGSVAVAGQTAVIGAVFGDSAGGLDTGAAYVYTLSQGVWTQEARLTASDGAPGDRFGSGVAIEGDTSVVGALWDDTPGGTNAGSAYVYTRTGTVWTQQSKLTASDGAAGDQFGAALALDGGTLIVGASLDDTPSGVNSGSAYDFVVGLGPPPMPTTVKASEVSPGVVKVTWKDLAPCETAFEFLREMKVGATWTGAVVAGSSPALPGTDRKGAWQQSPGPGAWRYSARAINAAGPSAWSAPGVVKPAAPSGLAAVWVAGGAGHNVKLTWVDNSGFESGSKFKREMQSGSSWINSTTVGNGQIGVNATMFTDTTITTPGVYRYRLQAFNNATNSAWTGWVQITVP